MSLQNHNEIVKNLTKIILINKKRMIREDDLKHLCKGFEFDQIISNVYKNLLEVGFELISSKFLDQKYYILTSEGKDDKISPSQYGTLALILALSKEIDENLKLSDLKDIFSEVWTSDVDFLIKNDFLRKINENKDDLHRNVVSSSVPDHYWQNRVSFVRYLSGTVVRITQKLREESPI